MKISLNELLIGTISKAFCQWVAHYGVKEVKQVQMTCPFSMKRYPTSYEDLCLDNQVAKISFAMPVTVDINKCVETIRPTLKEKTQPGQVILSDYFIKIVSLLPEWTFKYTSSLVASKNHILFTSLPTKQTPIMLFKKEVHKIGGFNYMYPGCNILLMCITHSDTLRLTLCSKTALKMDAKVLLSNIESILTNFT